MDLMLGDWLDANRHLAIYLVPLFAFAEACVGIGLFVSGIFLVAVATAAHTAGDVPMAIIVALAAGGAVAGDHAGYYLGLWVGPAFHQFRFVARYPDALAKGEALIRRYGALAIFIGRFVPAIRSLVPALLGISGFARLRYSLFDVLACLLWSMALGLIVVGIDTLL